MKNLVLREKRNLRQQEKENFKNKNNNILAGKTPAIFIFVGAILIAPTKILYLFAL